MIRHTAKPADKRQQEIQSVVSGAKFKTDPVVNEFGLTMDTNMVRIPARVLDPPTLAYSNNTITPLINNGSWDMQDNRFYEGATLNKWTILNCSRYCKENEIQRFSQQLERKSKEIGMIVNNKPNVCCLQRNQSISDLFHSLVPRLHPAFQRCTRKTGSRLLIPWTPS